MSAQRDNEIRLRRRGDRSSPAPLSFGQQRLWFLDQLYPNTAAYNMVQAMRLNGDLDESALERALNEVRRRHEILCTNFDVTNDQPVQVVAPFQPIPLVLTDFSSLSADQRDDACREALRRSVGRPYNLKRDPLMRASLFRLGPAEHVFAFEMHHIVGDGWSVAIIHKELSALYSAFRSGCPSPLPPLRLQYSDYARWQRERLDDETLKSHIAYWRERLDSSSPILELPSDRARAAVKSFAGGRVVDWLPEGLVERLSQISRQRHATLFMVLLAGFQVLVGRLSGQTDVVVGAPVAGREAFETEELVGFFLNALALRADLSGNPVFEELLGRIRSDVLSAIEHQVVPFEKIIEALQPDRSLTHAPFFQVMLNVSLIDADADLAGLTVEEFPCPPDQSKFDLTLYVLKKRQGLQVALAYDATLFDAARMEELVRQYLHLLAQIAVSPQKRIGAYSLVTGPFRRLLPNPAVPIEEPRFESVTHEFRRRSQENPTRLALVHGPRSWTYQELYAGAAAVATLLRPTDCAGMMDRGVVALVGPRSFGLIAGMAGVFMSGGVLLPVDRGLPLNRQRLMIEHSGARRLVYVGNRRPDDAWLDEVRGLEIISIPEAEPARAVGEDVALPDLSPDNPAYIFFTSGTTGVPKGVLGCHKGLSHFLAWQRSAFGIGRDDRCAQLTSLSFDPVLRDVFLPLTSGAALCLPDQGLEAASDGIMEWLEREAITTLHAVPSIAQHWLAAGAPVKLPKLRRLFFAGEPLTETLVRQWRAVMTETALIVNLYGPTETTLVKCFHVIEHPSEGVQPIGMPMPESQALVLNGDCELCGQGEPGEIVIRTPFRTLGYINAPEEQGRRFVKNPFRDDSSDILYYTGDLGRYRPDGLLEFLGRVDDQVKIRGVRIEPAEVSAVISSHPGVRSCVVTAGQDSRGEKILIAYIVPAAPERASASDLRAYLGERLPAVMMPQTFMFLDEFPLTPNGKIDRRKLPPPEQSRGTASSGFAPPRTPVEHGLAAIWRRVLKIDEVGVHDDLFDIGGHSLIATQLASQIRQEFQIELPLRVLFTKRTIESVALHILEQQAIASGAEIEALLAELESLPEEGPALDSWQLKQDGAPGSKNPGGDA